MTGLLYSASHGMWNDRTNLLHKSLQMILPDYFSPPDLTGDMTALLYFATLAGGMTRLKYSASLDS